MIVEYPFSGSRAIDTNAQITQRALLRMVHQDRAAARIILTAPDGGQWQITVTNEGALTTVRVG